MDEQKLVNKEIDQSYQGLEEAHQFQKTVLEDQIVYIRHSIAPLSKMDQDFLKIKFAEAEYKIQHILSIVLEVNAKVANENECQTICENNSRLEKKQVQSLSMIRVKCMQVLIDNVTHDTDWDNKSDSYD